MGYIFLFGVLVWSAWGIWEFLKDGAKPPKDFQEFFKYGPIFWIVEVVKVLHTKEKKDR